MKRYILTFIYTFLLVTVCRAQVGDTLGIAYPTSIPNQELAKAGYESISGRISAGLRLKNNGKYERFRSNFLNNGDHPRSAFLVEGDANIDVIATLINSKNANEFHYRVILNDKVLSGGWLTVNQFRKTKTGIEYAYLGNFSFKNQELRVQIEHRDYYDEREEFVMDNRPIKQPYINSFYLIWKGSKFWGVVELCRKFYTKDIEGEYTIPYIKHDPHVKRDSAGKVIGINLSDEIHHLEAYVSPAPDAYTYQLYLIHTKKQKSDTVKIPAELASNHYTIDKKFIQEPGKYKAVFVPEFYGEHDKRFFDKSVSCSFEVFPPNASWFSSKKIIISLIIIILLFAGFFLFYFRKNKRKLAQEIQRKDRASLELKSIHAQLNPHFIFNALSSIQNLINQQNIGKANEYLSTFSGLTRQILSNKDELISIADEHKMLEAYLKMEQLRFGFQYKISIDSKIDVMNAEIPAMLLQPFVENAIKHGVGSKGEKGIVEVLIEKTNGDLVIQIKDNGEGFDELHIKESSMGIKLCKERIKLLNQLHADAPVEMTITSNENGTLVWLQLNGWA